MAGLVRHCHFNYASINKAHMNRNNNRWIYHRFLSVQRVTEKFSKKENIAFVFIYMYQWFY